MNTISIDEREMNKVTSAILALAIKNSDIIHIFINYSPNVYDFSVHAYNANADYKAFGSRNDNRIYDKTIYLDEEGCVKKLLDMYLELGRIISSISPEIANEGK